MARHLVGQIEGGNGCRHGLADQIICLSVSLTFCLRLRLCLCLSLSLSVSVSVCLSLSDSVYVSLSLSLSLSHSLAGKLVMWHGWADQIIMPQGSIDYYNAVTDTVSAGKLAATQEWFRFFMAPGVAHCGMDTSVFFEALVAWVERGDAPARARLAWA